MAVATLGTESEPPLGQSSSSAVEFTSQASTGSVRVGLSTSGVPGIDYALGGAAMLLRSSGIVLAAERSRNAETAVVRESALRR